ncbi:MAG TPA: acylphosphatase [Candidatus Nanoarchaeia archaeon]|nr:acylphosphatase [Candidatus Nanoarchaeia archaeon]
MKQLLIFVSGNVQGVFYRAFVQKQALILGITGYVKTFLMEGLRLLQKKPSQPF